MSVSQVVSERADTVGGGGGALGPVWKKNIVLVHRATFDRVGTHLNVPRTNKKQAGCKSCVRCRPRTRLV